VDVICGTNQDEWTLFAVMDDPAIAEDRARRRAARAVPGGDELYTAYAERRPGASPAEVLTALMTDAVFRIPAVRLLEAHSGRGAAASRSYLFTWRTPAFDGRLGSCHALEIPFVWNNLHKGGADVFLGGQRPQGLADTMHEAWWRFATDGDPVATDLTHWPTYDATTRATVRFDEPCTVEHDPGGEERALWSHVR